MAGQYPGYGADVAERLRRLTRNQLGSPRAGSSPAVCERAALFLLKAMTGLGNRFWRHAGAQHVLAYQPSVGATGNDWPLQTVRAYRLAAETVRAYRFVLSLCWVAPTATSAAASSPLLLALVPLAPLTNA